MNKRLLYYISILTISTMLLTGCSSNKVDEIKQNALTTEESGTTTTSTITASAVIVDKEFTARDLEVGYEVSTATHITLNGTTIEVSGKGATSKESILTISDEGTYVITGSLTDGQIIVDADKKDKVWIVFNGVTINCSYNAPIYIKNADKVFVTLEENTENTLIDGVEYIQSDENTVDGAIFSKEDLTINGGGTLSITANYKHGIVSKDSLVITGGIYNINAVKDTLNGKDSVKIKDGSFTLSSTTGNGIQSKNGDDTTKGYVYICGGDITVLKGKEGIEGTAIIIEDGTIKITVDDDGLNASSKTADTSAEITTENPFMGGASSDTGTPNDAGVPNGGEMPDRGSLPNGGEMPDRGSLPNGGEMPDRGSLPNGGEMPDRGSMPEGKPNRGGFVGEFGGGFGGGDNPFAVNNNCYILISGGTITINASGDGIDSNGNLYVSGGTLYVNGPTSNGEGSLDYNGTGEISGGTVVSVGSFGMAQGFSQTSSQYSILYNFTATSKAETEITLTDKEGKVIISYKPNKQYQSVVLSSPDLVKDETYTIRSGEQTADITLTSISTTNDQQGMRGPRG